MFQRERQRYAVFDEIEVITADQVITHRASDTAPLLLYHRRRRRRRVRVATPPLPIFNSQRRNHRHHDPPATPQDHPLALRI